MNSRRIRFFEYLRGSGVIPVLSADSLRSGSWLRTYAGRMLISTDTLTFLCAGIAVGLLAQLFTQIQSDGETALLALTAIGFAALAVALTALSIFVSFVNDAYLRILGVTRKGGIAGFVIPYLATALISSTATTVGAIGALIYNALPNWLKATILGLEAGLVVWSAWAVFQIIIEVASHGLNRYDIALEIQKSRRDPSIDKILSEDGQAPTDHPDTLRSRAKLAEVYQEVGRTDKAISLFEQTLAAFERLLGPDHPDTLTSMTDLASAYREVGSSSVR